MKSSNSSASGRLARYLTDSGRKATGCQMRFDPFGIFDAAMVQPIGKAMGQNHADGDDLRRVQGALPSYCTKPSKCVAKCVAEIQQVPGCRVRFHPRTRYRPLPGRLAMASFSASPKANRSSRFCSSQEKKSGLLIRPYLATSA